MVQIIWRFQKYYLSLYHNIQIMENKTLWFFIELLGILAIMYVIGAFIALDPLWFISTITGRIVAAICFIIGLGSTISTSDIW
jgi:hypothetical protein